MVATPVIMLLGLGFAAAVILAVASKLLYVKEDPRIALVEDALAGANCGGCGYPGCAAAAAGVVKGEADASVCVVGGPDVALNVAAIMGMEVSYREPELAIRDCTGGIRAENLYIYEGAMDCRAMAMLHNGGKVCPEGCLGLGTCVRACPFGALSMAPDGLPVVDPSKCVACGNCERACPRGVMSVSGMSGRLTHLNETTDCLAPCRQRCPAQIDIPGYIRAARNGDYAEGVRILKERNPLILVCGRVCPHPCEEVCRRGQVDDPVAINYIKRFLADWEMDSGTPIPVQCAPDNGRKVAVIGGGPAGLSCANFLRRLGYQPTIFEPMPQLGGQLRYGIPEYRLPKKILDWEIQSILDLGVEARTKVRFGRDVTLDQLREKGFEAFFLGIGAWQSANMRLENEDSPGVMAGTEFLTGVGLGIKTDLGSTVIVVGGGNTAIDAARTAVRLGARSVTLMYRRTEAEMPANPEEIHAAKEEGIHLKFLAAPSKVILDDNGRAKGLEYITMELGEPDASGRRRPEPVPGSEAVLEADTIISAIGQRPDLSCLYEPGTKSCSVEVSKRWRIVAGDPHTLQTSIPDCFTGGDAYHGPALAVTAIGDGRRAARSIHLYLTGESLAPPQNVQHGQIPYTMFKDVEDVAKRERVKCPEICVEDRSCSFIEVEGAVSEEDMKREACRCLDCGLICYDADSARYPAQAEEKRS